MAGRTNRETGEITGHLNILLETTPMKSMNPAVIGSTYSELVIDLLKTAILAGRDTALTENTDDLVAYVIRLADQTVEQLDVREVKAREFAESTRVYLPVEWKPEPDDDQNRSGAHWSQPETDALIAQFKNGLTGSEIAVHHRRTWTAISAQLAKYGLLSNSGRGYERPDGSAWEL